MRRKTKLPDERLREELRQATDYAIYKAVLDESGIELSRINSKTRKQDVIIVRHLLIYFMSVNENRSFDSIGQKLMKNHATAMSSRTAVENWMECDHDFKLRVIKIATQIIRSMRKQIQLIGKVRDVPRIDAVLKFKESQTAMEILGWEVWNPMENVPLDIERGEEMRICLRNLIEPATVAVAVQPDWLTSEGSKVELAVAHSLGLKVIEL